MRSPPGFAPGKTLTDQTFSAFGSNSLLTEGITAPKYPLYRSAYQRRVGMFLPLESYWKRVYLSVVKGNDWRRAREVELGWHKEEAHSALKRE